MRNDKDLMKKDNRVHWKVLIGTIWNSICMRMTRAQAQRLNSQCASLHWSATQAQLQRQPNSKHHYMKNPNSFTFHQFYPIYLTPFCLALLWVSLPVAWLVCCFGIVSLHRLISCDACTSIWLRKTSFAFSSFPCKVFLGSFRDAGRMLEC